MEIKKNVDGNNMTVIVTGELDALTSPELDREIGSLEGVGSLTLDFGGVEYVSSAGLRVILGAKKRIPGGRLAVVNIQPTVREIMDMTGTSDLLGLR